MQAISLTNVHIKYSEKVAVNNLSFTVQKGEIFGLLGGNGAGKTSTMRAILGLLHPQQGSILWNGENYRSDMKKKIGYLPEERGLFPKQRIREQMIYLGQLRGMSFKEANISLCRWLRHFDIIEYYGKKLEELSKGNQQKIQFIASVIHNPDLLILDEVFSGLDPVNTELLKKTILNLKDEGKTIIFSSHRMDHVEELCENICILDKSHTVLVGNLNEIKNNYPKDRIVIESFSNIENFTEIPGVTEVKCNGQRYEIKISNEQLSEYILNFALQQTKIKRFQIMDPTLNEIFISKVGQTSE
ncbi:ABC transporter ATP-binding protein [Paenibacillus sp. HW567]|uniref:ABC transporter ATP-binding protein n=1 Tax=Paenibacillus sp. HW567 TaxID=1034769 RepID=UPI00036EA45E|nr:ATP-binding cassette domain-containing protein [Paenibacillus sp. HW567]